MTPEERLAAATAAFRQETTGTSPEASRTRADIIHEASDRTRRRGKVLWVAPFAAVLVASSAWASTHPSLWPHVMDAIVRTFSPKPAAPKESSAPPSKSRAAKEERPAKTVVVADALEKVSGVQPFDSLPRFAEHAEPKSPPATAAAESSPLPEGDHATVATFDVQDEASQLYAAAHHAHFVEHDPEVALRAWDDYLFLAPDGPFAPEARYNRAITLIRLGRREEARRALEPFTKGVYRAREARDLLEALER